MMQYFEVREMIGDNFMVGVCMESFPNIHTAGSYNVLGARVVGVSYAQYLRMCRDLFNAHLMGKGSKYVYPIFETKQDCQKLVDFLNKRLNQIYDTIRGIK